jgi:hypothetical protein
MAPAGTIQPGSVCIARGGCAAVRPSLCAGAPNTGAAAPNAFGRSAPLPGWCALWLRLYIGVHRVSLERPTRWAQRVGAGSAERARTQSIDQVLAPFTGVRHAGSDCKCNGMGAVLYCAVLSVRVCLPVAILCFRHVLRANCKGLAVDYLKALTQRRCRAPARRCSATRKGSRPPVTWPSAGRKPGGRRFASSKVMPLELRCLLPRRRRRRHRCHRLPERATQSASPACRQARARL